MRLLIACIAAVVAFSSVVIYIELTARPVANNGPIEIETSTEVFRIEVVLSFNAGADLFAENTEEATSLLVKLGNRVLFSDTNTINAGQAIIISDVSNLTVGTNELHLEATPEDASQFVPRTAKIEVYSSWQSDPIATQLLWADATDTKLSGNVIFGAPATTPKSLHNHDPSE
ncbi:MAG: hypothetical protein COA78_18640 [Blastopirellula sp.]|nr:MAG: hypothetical protein COA78_18640 [Blastopirellula sp.]